MKSVDNLFFRKMDLKAKVNNHIDPISFPHGFFQLFSTRVKFTMTFGPAFLAFDWLEYLTSEGPMDPKSPIVGRH